MQFLLFPALLLGCNDAGFDGVTIRPIWGFDDGCTEVTVTGRGFDAGVSGKLDDQDLLAITLPDPKTQEFEVGFEFYGVTPAAEPGYADLTVINGDGQTATVANAFYFVACPGAPYVASVSPGTAEPGTVVALTGCGYAPGMVVEFTTPDDLGTTIASAPLEMGCSSATFTVPAMAVGSYAVLITDGAGGLLYGANLCDSADTAYYGYSCEDTLYFTIGSGT